MFSFTRTGQIGVFGGQPAAAAGRPPVVGNITSGSVGSASIVCTYPGDIGADDIILAFIGGDGVPTSSWPGDWNELYDGGVSSGFVTGGWKRATGSETGTFTVTLSGSEDVGWAVMVLKECHLTSDPEVSAIQSFTSNPILFTSITPSWGQDNNIIIAMCGYDTGATSITAHPDGYTAIYNESNGSTFGGGSGAAYKRIFDMVSEDPGDGTLSQARSMNSVTIAVRGRPPTAGAARVTADAPVRPRGRFRVTVEGNHRVTSG